MNLPQGYETNVGERGSRLSGGERQRLSLARAFLRDSRILILDEPTSSVDLTTEASILQATEALMRNRTTFMIAHRVNTLRKCDCILVLDHGRFIEIRSQNNSEEVERFILSIPVESRT
jgi:ATP-binding cassette subfamily B protein